MPFLRRRLNRHGMSQYRALFPNRKGGLFHLSHPKFNQTIIQ
jgi:hypothetical protein